MSNMKLDILSISLLDSVQEILLISAYKLDSKGDEYINLL